MFAFPPFGRPWDVLPKKLFVPGDQALWVRRRKSRFTFGDGGPTLWPEAQTKRQPEHRPAESSSAEKPLSLKSGATGWRPPGARRTVKRLAALMRTCLCYASRRAGILLTGLFPRTSRAHPADREGVETRLVRKFPGCRPRTRLSTTPVSCGQAESFQLTDAHKASREGLHARGIRATKHKRREPNPPHERNWARRAAVPGALVPWRALRP